MYPPINPKAPFILHGGDYNPEQWDAQTWDEDIALMQQSHYKIATIGVFSWVTMQPAEDRFEWEWLDTIIDKLHRGGRLVCLATPTAAQPAWMSQHYPDVLRADDTGQRRHHGLRANYCPNSPNYRRFAVDIATRIAERYGNHPAVVLWHVSNEYAGRCYCDTCAAAFRVWLQQRYDGLDDLNTRWWTPFWSHTVTDWEQIEPPYANGETQMHALSLDYARFQNDAMLQCYRAERDALRRIAPNIPITTNLMGTYPFLDYRTWAAHLDVISWDCYPQPNDHPSDIAFLHDLHRGLKDGQPFLLLEQTPSSQNWQPVNALKRPGVLRLWSYLAIAHGSDSVMYFQWRRGRGGVEKFHGAVIEHSRSSDTRVFREVTELGAELERLGATTLGATTPARVALMFDWNNWWAIENAVGPVREKAYVETVRKHYRALWQRNIPVDIIFSDSDLPGYDLVIAPMLYMVRDGLADRVTDFVAHGGTFVTTYFSGIADEHDLTFEGYPGPLRSLMGVWIEEIDALYEGQQNRIVMADGSGSYTCGRLCDIVRPEGASVLATYGDDFYAGTPVVTSNRWGEGNAIYIASDPEARFLYELYGTILFQHDIQPVLFTPTDVEVAIRETATHRLLFVLNHSDTSQKIALWENEHYHELLSDTMVSGTLELAAYDVKILASPFEE